MHMNPLIISQENFNEVIKHLDKIQQEVSYILIPPEVTFIENQDFIKIMKISKRTAQTWHDEGLISFSQIGKRIYYRMTDIQALLDQNCNLPF